MRHAGAGFDSLMLSVLVTLMYQILSTTTLGTVSTNEPNNENSDFLSAFKTMASQNLPLLLVCILVPVFVLAVCIGGCLIFFKVRAYRRDKEEQRR